MKTGISVLAAAMVFISLTSSAQKIPETQVPQVLLNQFKQAYPHAVDVEWERRGDRYEVDFEIGYKADHEIIYTPEGVAVRHKEEIPVHQLPENVQTAINTEFPGFRMDDIERINENGTITYFVKVKTKQQKWKVNYDENGVLLSKVAD